MSGRLRAAAFFFALVQAVPVLAFPLDTPVTDSVTVAEKLKVLWDRTAPDPRFHYWGIVNRLTVGAVKGPVSLSVRYDVDVALEREEENVLYRPRKYLFEVQQSGVDLVLGDFYASLGRGIVLNVLKRDEFGEDTSIQGQRLAVDTDYFAFRGLAGFVNPGDPIRFTPAQAKESDPSYRERDALWGGEAVFSYPGVVAVGGRFVGATIRTDEQVEEAEFERDNQQAIFGTSVELPDLGGVAGFYAEYAWLGLEDRKRSGLPGVEDQATEGRALYFAFNAYGRGVDFLLEGKDYFRAGLKYTEGPSLEYERFVVELPKYDDEIGLRGRLGYRIPVVDLYAFVNYLHVKTHRLPPKDLDGHYDQGKEYEWADGVKHVYGGLEKDFSNSANVDASAGYREELLGRWIHAELDAGSPFLPMHSIAGVVQWREFQGLGLQEFTRYGSEFFSLTYSWSPYLSVTGQYEHSNEPRVGVTGAGSTVGGGKKEPKENFHAVEVKVRPREQIAVTVFWGAVRGGLRCSGGVCREVPPFEGFRAEVSADF